MNDEVDDVAIRYTRLPDCVTVFRQQWVTREGDCTITLMPRTPLAAPVRCGDDVILEPDAPVLWFTFNGAWHDVGRFHSADGSFTGWYANVLTPVEFRSDTEWATTDLCLDVWLGRDGDSRVLDEDELQAALDAGWIDATLAATARGEAARLATAAAAGDWPPRIARDWTLERARARLAERGTRRGSVV